MPLRVEMLPAERGDCILVEYGEASASEHRILIDGGHARGYEDVRARLLEIPEDEQGRRQFELLVVTHIDADHIDGVIAMLQDAELNLWFTDIWFNGWRQLERLEEEEAEEPVTLGAKQGEFLGGLMIQLGLPWNRYFAGRPIYVRDDGVLPTVTLPGGMELTLVSPTFEKLEELKDEWEQVLKDVGTGLGVGALQEFSRMLIPGSTAQPVDLGDETKRSTLDNSEANGASIAFFMEYDGHRLLMTGDAFADVMRPQMSRWLEERTPGSDRIPLDAFKLSHHGSKRNLTPQLMQVISCRNYLISTSGAGNARHPDAETLKLIKDHHHAEPAGELPTVRFNYRSNQTEDFAAVPWLDALYEDEAVLEF